MFVNRLPRIAVVALAILAVAAPVAFARPADHIEGYTLPHDTPSAESEVRQDLRHPDTVDHANGRGAYNSPEVVVIKASQPAQKPAADGLDWADAGLGAGTLLGLSLLALGGSLLVLQRRGRQLAG